MVAIVRTDWSGTSGGPGLTQFALLGAAGGDWNPGGEQAAVNAVRAFWNTLAPLFPDEIRLTVSPVVDTYDTNTGVLFASHTAPQAPAVVAGSSTQVYAGGAGGKITWNTGSIRDGRRVRGTTFLVPLNNTCFTSSGTIAPGTQTTVNGACAALITALTSGGTSLAVWSRPREQTETVEARTGLAFDVETGNMSNKTAILRGRRD